MCHSVVALKRYDSLRHEPWHNARPEPSEPAKLEPQSLDRKPRIHTRSDTPKPMRPRLDSPSCESARKNVHTESGILFLGVSRQHHGSLNCYSSSSTTKKPPKPYSNSQRPLYSHQLKVSSLGQVALALIWAEANSQEVMTSTFWLPILFRGSLL